MNGSPDQQFSIRICLIKLSEWCKEWETDTKTANSLFGYAKQGKKHFICRTCMKVTNCRTTHRLCALQKFGKKLVAPTCRPWLCLKVVRWTNEMLSLSFITLEHWQFMKN